MSKVLVRIFSRLHCHCVNCVRKRTSGSFSPVVQTSFVWCGLSRSSLASQSIQMAMVISHTEAFNYIWVNGSCLASRMTSRLNNRTIRALSGADGNTTWYLLNAPPSARARARALAPHTSMHPHRVCVFARGSSIHFKWMRCDFIQVINAHLLENTALLIS